jgi:CheY-like chemotaxis protein
VRGAYRRSIGRTIGAGKCGRARLIALLYAPSHEALKEMRRPRVLLADDYPRLVSALHRLLSGSCDVVGCVSSGRAAVETAAVLRPDVIVLDLTLPDVSGLEACRQIKLASASTIVVILTAVDDVDVRASALQVGASAFVPKQLAGRELEETIQRLVAETGA